MGDKMASDIWPEKWMVKHINWVELQVAHVTLQHFVGQVQGWAKSNRTIQPWYNPAGWDSSSDPEVVAEITSRGRRESAQRVHNARLAHFWRWYAARRLDPYSAPLYQIAKFLSDQSKMRNLVIGYCTLLVQSIMVLGMAPLDLQPSGSAHTHHGQSWPEN